MLAKVLATITGKARYFPETTWSSESWTHNVFRAFEYFFARRYGIRCEVTASYDKGHVTYAFHTWEAAIAHFEGWLRSFRLVPFKVFIPRLVMPGGMSIPASPFLFAIAYDNSGEQATSSSNPSFSLTVSGADRIIIIGPDNGSGGTSIITGCSYNSVAATFLTGQSFAGGTAQTRQYYLVAPATGTNTCAATGSNSDVRVEAASYTGVNQVTPIDAYTTQTGSGTSFSPSITTTQNNCYLVFNGQQNQATPSAGTGTIVRQVILGSRFLGDGAAPTAGVNSLTFTVSPSASWGGSIVSLAPIASTIVVYPSRNIRHR